MQATVEPECIFERIFDFRKCIFRKCIFRKICKFLAGSFSAVSKRNFARKYAFDSICQALQDLHTSALRDRGEHNRLVLLQRLDLLVILQRLVGVLNRGQVLRDRREDDLLKKIKINFRREEYEPNAASWRQLVLGL